jgi:hypothetical protein
MVFSVSFWCLFRDPMISFICFCVFSYSLFCCLGISCVFPLYFGWPCLVTSLWNSHWLLTGFLHSCCSCGPNWVHWYTFSLFCWTLILAFCFSSYPSESCAYLFLGENGFHPFFISHYSSWYCFCLCSMCNSVLANLQQ